MSRLAIYKDCNFDTTVVSNQFIDEFMKSANDAQLKVYFYLLRMVNANLSTSIADIADKFNHTEKDVIRALTFWEKSEVLTLDYNDANDLVGVHFRDFAKPIPLRSQTCLAPVVSIVPSLMPDSSSITSFVSKTDENRKAEQSEKNMAFKSDVSSKEIPKEKFVSYEKPSYSRDDIKRFKEDEKTSEIAFLAETYLERTLSPNEIQSLFFFVDVLGFSTDLIDYLLQYCASCSIKSFNYIEKVAINWAENSIHTSKQAQKHVQKFDKTNSIIMKTLGKSGSTPTDIEKGFIGKWTTTFCFSMEIIVEACNRTVLSVDNNRFKYADAILSNWYKAKVQSLADIEAFDKSFNSAKQAKAGASAPNKFNNFTQRSYNFEQLEKEILN